MCYAAGTGVLFLAASFWDNVDFHAPQNLTKDACKKQKSPVATVLLLSLFEMHK